MLMIETKMGGPVVPLSQVKVIERQCERPPQDPIKASHCTAVLKTLSGETYELENKTVGQLLMDVDRATAAVIPAEPGYEFLVYTGTPRGVSRFPIVAWRACFDDLEPVTVGTDAHFIRETISEASVTSSWTATLCPNGRVIEGGNDQFDNVDAWVKWLTERRV